jgi:aminoglycoside 3-N-acetyltransferase
MIRYKVNEFKQGFEDLGIKKGDVLNIHSSIFNFGLPSDVKNNYLPHAIFTILDEVLGHEGTIAVPAFNFDFCKGVPFNRQSTPPKLMGSFSEFVFSLKESIRSYHPMQSVSVTGRYADEITKHDTLSSFDENGPWVTMEKLNAKIVLLGSSFRSPSFIHLVEEREQVPYRYWKSFTGSYTDHGEESERTYKMYVREMEWNPALSLSPLEPLLAEKNLIRSVKIGRGIIICINASDFLMVATEKIRNNPYYFISNHPDYLKEY